ncbi:MAG TPA: gamma-glutamyl-gamma-aminobutyrate hydrolase family protein [Fimbriimonadaceae bacterium]|nr:gamma-glutamyl-gamma-aminobutyrate hydrolase family protein [Fimbriimonadaceae bacterium]
MSDKPIIGITVECKSEPDDARTRGSFSLNWNYAQAIAEAGGVPIVIPPTADPDAIAELIDGWLIPGGNDIDAAQFGEANHPKVELQDPARFAIEEALMKRLDPQLPVFGICYGCQFLNVIRGGSLEQHLPDRIGDNYHAGGTLDRNHVDAGSLLARTSGATAIEGKSYHHQAVGRLGEGLKAVAHHADGTVEAVEATDRPWMIGVQWHPERTLEDPATRKLFEGFVAAARAFRKVRQQGKVPA